MTGSACLAVVDERDQSAQSYWFQPASDAREAEERQRLAQAYVGPMLERVFVMTKLKRMDLVAGAEREDAWSQVIQDHAGRVLMQGDNAWQILLECCRLYRFENILEDAVRDFPEAKAILAAGYFRARLDLDRLTLQVYLPWGNAFTTLPI